MKTALQNALCLLVCLAAARTSAAELVVIVNPASGVTSMTRAEVSSVFMARQRMLPSGVAALPLDVAGNAPERQEFYLSLIGKTVAEVNSYWAQVLFSGRATPPKPMADAAAILDAVAENKGAIAYVRKANVDRRVRVVLQLESL